MILQACSIGLKSLQSKRTSGWTGGAQIHLPWIFQACSIGIKSSRSSRSSGWSGGTQTWISATDAPGVFYGTQILKVIYRSNWRSSNISAINTPGAFYMTQIHRTCSLIHHITWFTSTSCDTTAACVTGYIISHDFVVRLKGRYGSGDFTPVMQSCQWGPSDGTGSQVSSCTWSNSCSNQKADTSPYQSGSVAIQLTYQSPFFMWNVLQSAQWITRR